VEADQNTILVQSSVPKQLLSTSKSMLKLKFQILVAGVLVFLIIIGTASAAYLFIKRTSQQGEKTYMMRSYPQTPTTTGWKQIVIPKFQISLNYPNSWIAELNQDGEIAYFTFDTRRKDSAGEKEMAGFAVTKLSMFYGESFENSLHDMLKDNQKMIKFGKCQFTISGGDCLKLIDQEEWIKKTDNFPIQTSYFILLSNNIFGISWGQNGTFDIVRGVGPQILSTFKLTPPDKTAGTSSWKMYTGKSFSFKYSSDLSIQKQSENEIVWKSEITPGNFSTDSLILRSKAMPFDQPKIIGNSLLSISKNAVVEQINEEKTITLDGQEAKSYIIQCGPGPDCYYHFIYFKFNDTYYELINNIAGGGLENRFQQLLATLKFTPSSPAGRDQNQTEKLVWNVPTGKLPNSIENGIKNAVLKLNSKANQSDNYLSVESVIVSTISANWAIVNVEEKNINPAVQRTGIFEYLLNKTQTGWEVIRSSDPQFCQTLKMAPEDIVGSYPTAFYLNCK